MAENPRTWSQMLSPRALSRYLYLFPDKRAHTPASGKASAGSRSPTTSNKPVDSTKEKPKLVIPHRPSTRPTAQNVKEQDLLRESLHLYPKGLVLKEFIDLMSKVAPLPRLFYPLLWNRLVHPWNEYGADRISPREIIQFWKEQLRGHDTVTRLFHIIKRPANPYILPEDLVPVIRAMVKTHPGISFLQSMPEYREAFVQTALVRILYRANRSKTGKITIREFRASQLASVWMELDNRRDIDKSCNFFSYEHFYVIYCKFWCLDTDHDMLLSYDDMLSYDNETLSARVVQRVFEHRPCAHLYSLFNVQQPGDENEVVQQLTYCDFVWFFLSEVDKLTTPSVEYWFNIIDIDGDGAISAYELEYFWEEQLERGCDARFEDVFYQLCDIVRPATVGKIRLMDIKVSNQAPLFFDIIISKDKFIALEYEENVHFVHSQSQSKSVWDAFAEQEYAQAVLEASEGAAYRGAATSSSSYDDEEEDDDGCGDDFLDYDDPMMDQWAQDTQEYFRMHRPRSLSIPANSAPLKGPTKRPLTKGKKKKARSTYHTL